MKAYGNPVSGNSASPEHGFPKSHEAFCKYSAMLPSMIFKSSPSSLLLLNVFSIWVLHCRLYSIVQCCSDSNSEADWRAADKNAATGGRERSACRKQPVPLTYMLVWKRQWLMRPSLFSLENRMWLMNIFPAEMKSKFKHTWVMNEIAVTVFLFCALFV